MVANQQQMPQIPAIVLVRPDSEPGQFKLDIQRGPAFRPNKGQHIGPVQVLHAKSPKNSNAQYRKAQDGGQNHQIVGQRDPSVWINPSTAFSLNANLSFFPRKNRSQAFIFYYTIFFGPRTLQKCLPPRPSLGVLFHTDYLGPLILRLFFHLLQIHHFSLTLVREIARIGTIHYQTANAYDGNSTPQGFPQRAGGWCKPAKPLGGSSSRRLQAETAVGLGGHFPVTGSTSSRAQVPSDPQESRWYAVSFRPSAKLRDFFYGLLPAPKIRPAGQKEAIYENDRR